MGKINILTSDIYNKISAGEVVERPQSVVKELVENSIDAGASRVEISIEGGGISYIEVSDNGCGIDEEDMSIAFMQHSTSKLFSAAQLFDMETLGFRGEALASIAAVSDVAMVSKTPYCDTACKITIKNGQIVDRSYISGNVGTKIIVSDLFYNVPARKKFLKSVSRETTLITQYIVRLILTNPNMEICYRIDGETIYKTQGCGLEESIMAVYGSKCLTECIPISSSYKGIVVSGYIGSPEYSKANSTYQTLAINGRFVKDSVVVSAVKQAYMPFLMTRAYPFFVLHITMDRSDIDVNVHPQKLEVRFSDSQKVFVAVAYPIKEALKRFSEDRVQRVFDNNKPVETKKQMSIADLPISETETDKFYVSYDEQKSKEKNELIESMHFSNTDITQIQKNNQKYYEQYLSEIDYIAFQDLQEFHNTNNIVASRSPAVAMSTQEIKQDENLSFAFDFSKIKTHGIAFNTYLMLEIDERLIFVDQHAAHERILYDKYLTNAKNLSMQPMLIPYVFSVSAIESEFIKEHLNVFLANGFDIQPFGNNAFRVVSVASIFANCNLDRFVRKLLVDVDGIRISDGSVLNDTIAKLACKSATKAGDVLNDQEIEYIVRQIISNKQLQCPHGRPITIELSKEFFEKQFKRIVC